uniref:Uncharacterized protein n=2 Tax=Crocodylus porosus TaxID=8502 RepID=A0A7M4EAM5_CROPO
RERRLRAWARATTAERRRERLEQEQQQQQRLAESLALWPGEQGRRHREPGLRGQRPAQEQEARQRDTLDRAKRPAQPKKRQADKKRLGEREAHEPRGSRLQDRMAQALEKKLLKDTERRRHAQAPRRRPKEQVDHQVQAEELYRRLAIEQRLQRSQEILDQLMEERNEELKGRSLGEEEQGLVAQLRAKETEEEKKHRKSMLLKIAEMKIQQARDMLAQNAEHKARRSKEVNGVKERGHRFQRYRIEEEDKSYLRDTQEAMRWKDQKSSRMSRDKEATREEARKRAGASYGLREKMRELSHSHSFG